MTTPPITREDLDDGRYSIEAGDERLYDLGFIAALSSDGEAQDLGETIGVGGGQMVCIGEVLEGWGIKVYGKDEDGTFFVARCDKETGEMFADIVRGLALKAAALTASEARIRELEEALTWTIAEIEGRSRYTARNQFGNCLARARAALSPARKEG